MDDGQRDDSWAEVAQKKIRTDSGASFGIDTIHNI